MTQCTWMRKGAVTATAGLLMLTAGATAAELDMQSFLRDHAQTRGFSLGRPVKPTPTPDGKAVLFLRAKARDARQELYEFDVASGATRLVLTPEQLLGTSEEKLSPEERARRERMRVSVGGFTDFQLSRDGSMILVCLGGRLYVVERSSGRFQDLKTGEAVLDPKFSPDGKSVAYVREYDLYVMELARQRIRRLTEGGKDSLSHGLAEFVAQEEMARFSGYWWSPDSRFLAVEEADADRVEKWHVADPAHPERPGQAFFYPRPGKENVRVRLGIVPAGGGEIRWIGWDDDRYPYLGRVDWAEHGGLTMVVQTRDQTELALLRVEPRSGKTSKLLTESDPAWVNLNQEMPHWLKDGSGFLWISERAGAPQLELRSPSGGLLRVLVPPATGCKGLCGVDETSRQVYFRASADPTQSHLYRVPLAGGEPVALTFEPGLHNGVFSKDFTAYVQESATLEAMPRSFVRRADGSPAGQLPSVAEEPPFLPHVELVRVGEEPSFHAQVVRPREFVSTRKYPVLLNVYGGPHVNMVQAAASGELLNQWIADQGFIVVSIDGRGTPGRGREWERAISRKFGSVPLGDQVGGLVLLGKKAPELDLERIGVFGWSFGGYMSALAVLRRPDVFKAAVAGAPVTDWLDYDTHYTERYLGLPDLEPSAYKEGSLLTYAADLSRPLMLIHGTADDNVYFRHTLKLADALFRAGKHFDLLPLPGATHGVRDPEVTERLWSRVVSYFKEHLGQPKDG